MANNMESLSMYRPWRHHNEAKRWRIVHGILHAFLWKILRIWMHMRQNLGMKGPINHSALAQIMPCRQIMAQFTDTQGDKWLMN